MAEEIIKDVFTPTCAGRIHHIESGSGRPLVLLHSTGFSSWQWRKALPGLARSRRVLAVDLLGHGDSDSFFRHCSIIDHAKIVLEWMEAIGLGKPVICGNSIGGVICLALASEFAGRIGKAILVETPVRDEAQWKAQWANSERYFSSGAHPYEIVQSRFAEPTPELHERWNIDRNKAGARVMVDGLWAIRQFDAPGALVRLQTSAIAIFGEKGPVRDVWPLYIEKLGSSAVTVLPGCGHFPMIDDPMAFVSAVDLFDPDQAP